MTRMCIVKKKYLIKFWFWVLLCISAPDIAYAKNNGKLPPHHAIVLLHGIANNASSFKEIQEALEKEFPRVQVISLRSAEGINSVMLPIEDQASAAYLELKKKIQDIKNTDIVLVGCSQGGIRAYSMLQKYAHELNIKGLVAISVPWEGGPIARANTELVKDRLTAKIQDELRLLSCTLGYVPEQLEANFMKDIKRLEGMCLLPGAQDIMVESNLLKQVAKTLPNITVPILSIASQQSSFETLFNLSSLAGKLQNFNNFYTWLVVGEHACNRKHDMLVPVYSQHALNVVKKRMKNFKRCIVSHACHSSIVFGITIPSDKYMLSHPHVIKKIIQFSKRYLLS